MSKFIDIWLTTLSTSYTSSDTKARYLHFDFGISIFESSRFSFGEHL
ncbi:MAG: hypothetical protein IPN18_16245 [Ignavibacteriales bacterium]|nr:hypothetical protein [Ignavibacteriales bacterium]